MNYDEKNDVYYTVVKMPGSIKGFCYEKDGYKFIVLNKDNLSEETYQHELNHLNGNHLRSDLPVSELERLAG